VTAQAEEARRLFRKLAGGVAVVTSCGGHEPVGLTASSVTSVSLQPPMLLVCVGTQSSTLAAIRLRQCFAVHLLRDDQRWVAEEFCRPGNGVQRFGGVAYRYVCGVPVIRDALAWSVCALEDDRQYGDHHVVVGRVLATRTGDGRPLVWHDRCYVGLSATIPRPSEPPLGLEMS
jgi:flavin reductase (DIM6/NTAB) family NADH-FMN oxidoreductase RutF